MEDFEMQQYFVSTEGNDRWSGKKDRPASDGTDGPFATIHAARDAIRRLKLAGRFNEPVEVLIRGGLYAMTKTFYLRGADGGTEECPITYGAYPGETPVLSGGMCISGWSDEGNGIYAARLPDNRFFRQLFCNGQRMTRCRYPKLDKKDPLYGGWAFIESLVHSEGALDNTGIYRIDGPWRFRTDPARKGEEQRWFNGKTDDRNWPSISTGASWQQQGHDFSGHAWYRTGFKMPDGFDTRRHLWLVFGAVDKGCHVYIDGKKVFEHTTASTGLTPEQIWNIPFKFDARPHILPGRTHCLTVKVESEYGAGGIIKPVSLVSADSEVNLSVVSGEVENPASFTYAESLFPHRWQKPRQAEIFVFPGKCWISDIIPIRSIDYENRVIHLTRPVCPSKKTIGSATHLVPGNRFYVENNLEDLTEPGEWCLDTDTRTVYFRPPDGVDINSAKVTVPCVERLVEMTGSTGEQGQVLSYVNIRGLRFTQTLVNWPSPQSYYKTPNAGSALYMENTRFCSVEDNIFDSVGGDAVRLQNHNACNRIAGNHISNAGAYGIFIAAFQKGFARSNPDSGDVPEPDAWKNEPEDHESVVRAWPRSGGHIISRNHIHNVGIYEKHGQGIAFFGVSAPNVIVSQNHIHHAPRFGIGLMSGFGRVVIENNYLHDLSLETCDTGGITSNRWYTYHADPELREGVIIRYNRIFDVVGCGAYGKKAEPGGIDMAGGRIWINYYSWAIYFDNMPMDVQVYGNITARNTLGGIMISRGWNIEVHDNIFLESGKSQVYLALGEKKSGLRIERNIFSYSNPGASYIRLALGKMKDHGLIERFDRNVIHAPGGTEPSLSGVPGEFVQRMGYVQTGTADASWAWWTSMGFDVHSVLGDPEFVDPGRNDFDLKPDSPALKLGFKSPKAFVEN
ncbi:MAG: right-handed parallel beta-helix repeat-containing protein [Candidatus Omnitrophica bacterium]|nr:right-handed parallel beta-helix repeat-containing protein [Candidatus Omnitrophota bacterium]